MARRIRFRFPLIVSIGTLALAANLVVPAAAQDQKTLNASDKTVMVGGAPMFPSKNIVQNAAISRDHTTLVSAVKAAGLVETLQGKGPFTVFAPTNAAFGKLPPGTIDALVKPENKASLTRILTYHVVPGRLESSDFIDGMKLKTIEGEELTVKRLGDMVMIIDAKGGSSTITIPNVNQSNGVIHVVDHVLIPAFNVASNDKNIPIPIQQLDDFFPWPPITPTAFYKYPDGLFLDKSRKTSLGDVSRRLDQRLDLRGYTDRFYFSQRSGNGFVVLTRMERIEPDGKSAQQERWTSDVRLTNFSISDLASAILGRRQGFFRMIALVVTQDSRAPVPNPMTAEWLKLWQSQGQPALPKGYDDIALTKDHNVYALIYEFERTIDMDKPVFVEQSNLSTSEHLAGAGLAPEDFK